MVVVPLRAKIAKKGQRRILCKSVARLSPIVVGLLSQTWGPSFDGRSGQEKLLFAIFLLLNTQYNWPENVLSQVSGDDRQMPFSFFFNFILSATALCGWEGVAGVWNCYQSRSKDKLLGSQMWQRGNSLWGQAILQNVFLRFCHMYFSVSVACISDSLWGQALL